MRIAFLCTGNSCRSQMAEGWARSLRADRFDALSAGTKPTTVNPLAVRVMAEVGVDISAQRSKHIADLAAESIDLVVTVCNAARESCPILPGVHRTVHRVFDDPPHLAASASSEEEALPHYRRVRDEIRAFILSLPDALNHEKECT
ncbi:MAG: arsenate reductase ArsC [Phycisphaerales bacterium]|nr:arsenate reductase ArsC [Phycisphaerales bacterium]